MTVGNEVISVEVCEACGTEVRAQSLYCYNCGGKVNPVDAGPSEPEADAIKPRQNGASLSRIDDPIVDSTSVPRTTDRKRRRAERKSVRVAWERTDGPGYLLLLFAVGVAVIVFGMLAIAAYLN